MTVIGIDSGSKICGVAVFKDRKLIKTIALEFDGTYDFVKFKNIMNRIDEIIFEYGPELVILEDPLAVRNGRITRVLNQIAGGILGLAVSFGADIETVHNKTIKNLMGIKTKEDSIRKVKSLYGKSCQTSDEADAVLVVESYYARNRTETKQHNKKSGKIRTRN